jgi:hypothetical protein
MRPHQTDHVLWRNRHALHIHEPAVLLRPAVGYQQRDEDLAEGRIVTPPPKLDQLEHGLGFVDVLRRRVVSELSACIGAVENQMTDALRIPGRVNHCHRRSLATTKKNELLQPGCVDDGFEVGNEIIECQVLGIFFR